MDPFEQKIKALARQEEIILPQGFDERIEKRLAGLPAGKSKKDTAFKVLLITALFVALSAVTALASPDVQRMAKGLISYFSSGQKSAYLSQEEALQKYNSTVGIAVQDQGITLKIDNIAVDDGYINVFYTVSSNTPIKVIGSENTPMNWRLKWTAPVLFFKANNQDLTLPALIEQEAYLENTTTLKGMERFAVIESLPDEFRLDIYTEQILNVHGNWQVALNVDKSAPGADTLVVTPKIQTIVNSGWDQSYKHNVTIDKVLISPFGSQIVLSELTNDVGVLIPENFALKDDQGRFMDVVFSQFSGGRPGEPTMVTNSFEFLNGSTKIKTLTLIPLASNLKFNGAAPAMATAPLSQVPFKLQQNAAGTIVVDQIELNEQEFKITYHADGFLASTHFILLDQNGKELKDIKLAVDHQVDRKTGQHIDTYTFTNHPSAAQIAQIKKLGTLTYDVKLRPEEQIVIPLQ